MPVDTGGSPGLLNLRAKRASVRLPNLKKKKEAHGYGIGGISGKERALVRVGAVNTRILLGDEDLSLWDKDELQRGQKKNKNGNFQGRPPVVIPKAIHDELVRRTLSEAQELMRSNLVAAVKVLTQLATSDGVDAKDRIKAIDIIMNRVMGKEVTPILVGGEAKWEVALRAGIVPLTALEDPTIDIRSEG